MIRERRPEDLDRLCAAVAALELPAHVLSGRDPLEWLTQPAELSWVYDMAPVHVTPTANVVGHVQIYRLTAGSGLAGAARWPAGELSAIGRLLVEPRPHAMGIARHLLKEARTHIRRQGRTAVLDVHANASLTTQFCARYGFVELPSADPGVVPMIYVG